GRDGGRIRYLFVAWCDHPPGDRLMRGVMPSSGHSGTDGTSEFLRHAGNSDSQGNLLRLPDGASAEDAAEAVNAAGAHVVMDLLGWLPVGRVHASLEAVALLRPALAAIHAHGFYSSSGGAVDWVVADRIVWPPEASSLAHPAPLLDAPLLLPPSFQANAMRELHAGLYAGSGFDQRQTGQTTATTDDAADSVSTRAERRRRLLEEAGATLPGEAPASSDPPTICLPHEYFKISPEMWDAVMGVMREEGDALLLLPTRSYSGHAIPALRRAAERLGVNASRVVTFPRARDRAGYLKLLQGCDVMADAEVSGACRWVGRVGASLGHGFPQGVATVRSWGEYSATLSSILRHRDKWARRLFDALASAPLWDMQRWRADMERGVVLCVDLHLARGGERVTQGEGARNKPPRTVVVAG
ncbi:hypothetical protein T484DRAFT_1952061, partial [Baffinella frigidus]